MGDMGYETYCTLYDSYILPVANYAAGVWGYENYPAPQVLQNRIMRFFLGVHRFAPLPALWLEMDWINIQKMRWLDLVRLYNRLVGMQQHRLPRKLFEWDCKLGGVGWVNDLVNVCNEINIQAPVSLRYIYDLQPVKTRILRKCREEWKSAAEEMSKLSTYCNVKDFAEPALMVKCNIHRNERSLLSRLLCGILPLKVEIGRYTRKGRKEHCERLCKVCESATAVEDEIHHIFKCPALKTTRDMYLNPILLTHDNNTNMSDIEKLQWLLSKDKIKEFIVK